MKCKYCGKEIDKNDAVCPHCKAAVEKQPVKEPKKTQKKEE